MKNNKPYSQADRLELSLQLVEESQPKETITTTSRSSVDIAVLSQILENVAHAEHEYMLIAPTSEPVYWN